MKALLFQIGFLFGGVIAGISLGFNLLRRMDLLTAVIRSGILFCVATIVIVVFLHFFALVLHRFVTEEMARQAALDQEPEKQEDNNKVMAPSPASRARTASRPDRPSVNLKGRS